MGCEGEIHTGLLLPWPELPTNEDLHLHLSLTRDLTNRQRVWEKMGCTRKDLSLSLLALLALLTASPPPWVSADTTVVRTQQDLIAALQNESVKMAQLAGNLRLDPDMFGTGLLRRQSDFVVRGGQDYPIFDFSFIEYKIYLAPGVRFTLEQVGRRLCVQREVKRRRAGTVASQEGEPWQGQVPVPVLGQCLTRGRRGLPSS